MFTIKKTLGLIALASLLTAGVAAADESSAVTAPKAEKHISVIGGFKKLWKETGIYRFIYPRTAEEKRLDNLGGAIKTAEAEISG
jgi:hypothetical protein